MPNRDGIVSIGFDYKKDLEKMIKDFEAEMNTVSSNAQLSKGMKKQFDNILAEMREFKASMDKELANLGSGKVSQSSFKSFKQTIENKFKGIREDIDRLDLAVATLNDSMGVLGKGVDLRKISSDFKNFEDYVTRTNSAVENLIHTLGEQGISLFSFDDRNISDVQSTIRKIENELKQLDKDTGAEFELFDEKQAQDELNRLSVQLTSTLELMENTKKQMENMDVSTDGFKKARGEFALLQLKAASLNDTIEMLYEVTESKGMYIEMDDKSLSIYEKYTDELADNLEMITSYAKNAKKELSSLLDTQKAPAIKVSSEMNPNSSELATVVTIDTTSSELWKKLSPIMQDLQGILNSNPVIAPVKLVVAPTAVSSVETGNLDISNSYSKKYAKVLAQTGEDAVVDLEGIYKKTFTSVMDTAVSYAKETIGKIQEIFDKNPIGVKFDISQEEIDKIQNFVLSNKDGKKVDISGQITKAKQEVEELNEDIEKTAKLLDDTKSKGNIKFDGFDKFTQDVSKSIGKLEELQNILKALQNIEITLAKASGIASITELDNQWANVEKRIVNATKLDGSFRKNASVSKIASEYQKYVDMGGTNSIADIDKIKDSKDTIDAIISKAKEFAKQDLSNNSVKELSIELDSVIGKFDELIVTVKTATNALYKIIKQTGVSELDKQWSSITNKFKSFANESGKINLSKQKKDVEELLVMYQRYVSIGGSHTPFDLTDNLETVAKLNKAYKKLNETKLVDDSSTIASESESFKKVEQSVDSLTKAIGDTKVQAINIEATTMEDAAEREILAINAIVDNLNMIVSKLKEIKGIKIPKIQVESVVSTSPAETNISSPIKDTFQEDTKGLDSLEKRLNELFEDSRNVQEILDAINKDGHFYFNWVEDGSDTEIGRNLNKVRELISILKEYGYEVKNFKEDSDAWSTSGSIVALGDESKKFGDVAENAERASKGKDNFAKANKKVKESADSSADSIEKETSALDEKEWDKNVKAIQEYMDVNTKLNNLKAQDKGTGKKASEIAYQTKEVEKLEKVALEARTTLSSMINPHSVPIDDWKKWLEMMKQFDQATEGSARSVVQLEDALRNMQNSKVESFESKKNSYIKKLNPYTNTEKYTGNFANKTESLQTELKNLVFTNPEDIQRLEQIEKEIDNIVSDSQLLENKLVKQDSKIADIISKMKIFRDSNTNMSKSQRTDLQALIDSAEAMAKTGDVTAEAIENIKIGFSGIKAEVTATGNTGLKMIDRIVQRTQDMNAKFIAQFFSWQDWLRYLREGFTIINEIDKSLTELRKVSNGTASDLNHALKSATEDAKELGASISNIVSMQSDWAKLGFSIPESEELARVTQLYVNVGDNMSTETASENLISTLQGFQLEAEDSENIVSMFNEVANNFAIDTQGIGEALKRSAASFNSANTSLSESIALVTTANVVVQDPDSIGTTFKTMSARIRGAETELESLGEETDEYTKTTSKLRDLIQGLTGFDIMEDEDTFKSIYDIVLGIGKEWENLSDIEQASLGEAIAGKRNANVFYSVMQNIDELEDAYKTAEESAGSAQREQENYEKSIQYSIDSTRASLEDLVNTFNNSGFFKGIIDAGGDLFDLLNLLIDKFGALGTLAAVGGGIFGAKNAGKYIRVYGISNQNCFEYALHA